MVMADPLASYQQGFGNALQAGQQVQQMTQRNALADLYRTQGQGIAQGDGQALNALAALDPMAAMDIRRNMSADQRADRGLEMQESRLGFEEQRLGMDQEAAQRQSEAHTQGMEFDQERLEQMRAEGRRAAETHTANMDEITRQREAEEINAALSSASAAYAQGPQAFEAWKQQNAEMIAAAEMDPAAVTYEAFPGIAAGLIGAKEGLLAGLEAGQALNPAAPSGRDRYDTVGGQLVDLYGEGGPAPVPGIGAAPAQSRVVTGEEAKAYGLDPAKAYNITEGPEGTKATAIGGGGTNVNVNTGDASSEFDKAADKKAAETFIGLSDAGMTVPSRIAMVDELEGLLSTAPAGTEAAIKYAAGNLGINTEGLDNLQAAQAIISRLVPEQRKPGSGPMSDADLALFKQALPRLINTREGNQQIARTMRGLLIYEQQQATIANQVLDGTLTPSEGRAALMKLQNPLQVFRRQGETTIGGYKIREVTE